MIPFYVYIVQEVKASATAPIKIGVASNVQRRLEGLQTCNPRELKIKALFGPMSRAAAYSLEDHLHKNLAPYHLRGEWFSGKALSALAESSARPPGVERVTKPSLAALA
jgi:hypothetical protein